MSNLQTTNKKALQKDFIIVEGSQDRLKSIRQLTHTICLYYFSNVTNRELDLLCEIINVGDVCKEAKESFMHNYQTTKENTAQIINRLSKKNIIVDRRFRTGRELHPTFMKLKDLINGDGGNILITFG